MSEPFALERGLLHIKLIRITLKITHAGLGAGHTVQRMHAYDKVDNELPCLFDLRGLGLDDHAILDLGITGDGMAPASLNLDKAQPAGTHALHAFQVTEVRYVYARQLGGVNEVHSLRRLYIHAVYVDLHRLRHLSIPPKPLLLHWFLPLQ